MAKQTSSGWGIFGMIIIAIGIFAGFIMQNIYFAVAGVCVGLFFALISSVIDRLDEIIGLLKGMKEEKGKSPDSKEEA